MPDLTPAQERVMRALNTGRIVERSWYYVGSVRRWDAWYCGDDLTHAATIRALVGKGLLTVQAVAGREQARLTDAGLVWLIAHPAGGAT